MGNTGILKNSDSLSHPLKFGCIVIISLIRYLYLMTESDPAFNFYSPA